jgi:signal transduction histidine kinase
MVATPAPANNRENVFALDFMRFGLLRGAGFLAVFALAYALLVWLGVTLHESVEELTVIWPASGLLFVALWLSPYRNWIWLLLIQLAVELCINMLHSDHFSFSQHSTYALANSIDALVGALVAKRVVVDRKVPRLRNVVLFIAATAIGATVGSVLGAFASTHVLGSAQYWRELQLWWAGNWLGSLSVAPVLVSWIRFQSREYSSPAPHPLELMLISFLTLALTSWVFSAPPGGVATILDMPFIILAFVVLAAFRMPPRWSTSLAAVAALLVSYFVSRGLGPFANDPTPFVRVGAAQLYLVTLVVVNFLLTVVLLERHNAYLLLRTSDERYRNFIESSSEAVWRVELSEPLDPALPVVDQIAWLQSHAYVAEINMAFLRLSRQIGISESEARQWRADVPWFATIIDHLGAASHRGYAMDDLQVSVSVESQQLTFITGFRGVMENGKLVRVWGVAREVTELFELNGRLRHNQARLQLYARELVGAEERARRATAVDLHDGIGQQLVGLAMTLDALTARSPPAIRLLLSEATTTVREVQAIAQRVIADLSPPGLYELGLEPALKWLSVYMRSHDNLQVELRVAADDAAIDIDLRVLVFKVIRELLRNVVKHAGVRSATVTVTRDAQELRAIVEDQGVGFEWQLSLFEPRAHGFGLWSVADRVREARGEMNVDTGPGRGCRVTVSFPLGAARTLITTKDLISELADEENARSRAL